MPETIAKREAITRDLALALMEIQILVDGPTTSARVRQLAAALRKAADAADRAADLDDAEKSAAATGGAA